MIYVIGSGPAGVSCAHALLERGFDITMIDAGVDLEDDKKQVLETLSKSDEWPQHLLQKITGEMTTDSLDGPKKLAYASDYPYKNADANLKQKNVLCRPSHAKGGLSTVWGASVMPYSSSEIQDWPISIRDLAPHYKKVLSFMHISCVEDELTSTYPLYTHPKEFKLSKQASLLYTKWKKNKTALDAQGISFGRSRLAVDFQTSYPNHKYDCTYCGRCLYGCPYELIYSTVQTLNQLKSNDNFTYIPGIIVDKIDETEEKNKKSEKDKKITIRAHNISGSKKTFHASRVFLACGSIHTTNIMLRSTNSYNIPISLKDSQHFFLPCIMHGSVSGNYKESHALCQLFLEIQTTNHIAHLQLYTFLDLYEKKLQKMFGPGYNIFKGLFDILLKRIVLIKGYLHSSQSSQITITLHKGKKIQRSSSDTLTLAAKNNNQSKKIIKNIVSRLFWNQRKTGIFPLLPMLKLSKPGGGNHYGGSFPMVKLRNKKEKFQTNRYGVPQGYKRVHLVDASVFPSISPQTITLTIMANAHRIASTFKE